MIASQPNTIISGNPWEVGSWEGGGIDYFKNNIFLQNILKMVY